MATDLLGGAVRVGATYVGICTVLAISDGNDVLVSFGARGSGLERRSAARELLPVDAIVDLAAECTKLRRLMRALLRDYVGKFGLPTTDPKLLEEALEACA